MDAVFSSEAYGDGLAAALGAMHVCVDPDRTRHPVSGTAIRADVHAHREALDPRVYAHFVRRVVLMGAESTGKTTLAAALAAHYETAWVEEYGRFVFEREARTLTPMHHLEIAHGHIALEDTAVREGRVRRVLVSDTGALTTLHWSYLLTRTAEPALAALADGHADRYALTLVCGDDGRFAQNGWRSTPMCAASSRASSSTTSTGAASRTPSSPAPPQSASPAPPPSSTPSDKWCAHACGAAVVRLRFVVRPPGEQAGDGEWRDVGEGGGREVTVEADAADLGVGAVGLWIAGNLDVALGDSDDPHLGNARAGVALPLDTAVERQRGIGHLNEKERIGGGRHASEAHRRAQQGDVGLWF